jgi:hypothetical protein
MEQLRGWSSRWAAGSVLTIYLFSRIFGEGHILAIPGTAPRRPISTFFPFTVRVVRGFNPSLFQLSALVSAPVNRPDLLGPFDQFWKERHIVLHGPKIPLKWVDNVLGVPPLGVGTKGWHDKMMWEDLQRTEFEFLATTVGSCLRELERRLDWCLAELRKVLPASYDWKPVVWPMINAPGQSLVSYPSSSAYDSMLMGRPSGIK